MVSFAPVRNPKSTDYSVKHGINGNLELQLKRREFLEKFPFLGGCDEKNGIGGNLNKKLPPGALSIFA